MKWLRCPCWRCREARRADCSPPLTATEAVEATMRFAEFYSEYGPSPPLSFRTPEQAAKAWSEGVSAHADRYARDLIQRSQR